MTSKLLEKLNPSQRQAVETTEGAVLVIAGAGSGKTRALTHRVAYLILEKNVRPMNILAVTFTNKAASEMKERIIELLSSPDNNPNPPTYQREGRLHQLPHIGTFHSICVQILRREMSSLGREKNFVIFDDQDQLSVAKKTLKELQIDATQFKPQALLGSISKAKNQLLSPEEFSKQAGSYWEDMVAKFYAAYQKKLAEQNALDFDDILLFTVKLFQNHPAVLEKYQNLFRYIMVDEYQDTNQAQYLLIKLLSQKFGNLCVVGDDWQGIYSWRGANIQNILDFEKDYPKAKIIKLEQNYRSNQNILDAAYGVISKNINRKDKKIWTENKEGHLLTSFEALDEREEAEFITREIERLKKQDGANLNDFVVLYRTNAQSRVVEEAMLRASLAYRIIGGLKFYQRKEIKDIVAYLRLINNFNDQNALERVINLPKRNLGPVTISKWIAFCKNKNLNLIDGGMAINEESGLTKIKLGLIQEFSRFIIETSQKIEALSLTKLIEYVFQKSGYEKMILDGTEEGKRQHENVLELLTVAKKYVDYQGEEALTLFLEEVSLVADTDRIDQATEAVHLMTLHSAKGLEFNTVFIIGLEEGILPHSRSLLSESEMEEERRLMYVGVTRARKKVYLLFASERNIYGSTQINSPSRFLDDIPEDLVERGGWNSAECKTQNITSPTQETAPPRPMFHAAAFKGGEKIFHPDFGEGMVVGSQGDILTIAFKKSGLKKISASIAPLKKI